MENWSSAQTAELYDRWARRFPMYSQTSADLVRIAEVRSGDHVVDLCCGIGVTTEEVLRAVGPEGRVSAVDGSPEMLDVARRRTGVPNVVFRCCPAESFHLVVDAAMPSSAIRRSGSPTTCVESAATMTAEQPTPCTLMSNFVDFLSFRFGTLEGAVIRGHAVDYASP